MSTAHQQDIETMSATELRKRYPHEYISHRNMKQREKDIAPEFMDFRSFLKHMGPIPKPGMTLDRIDHTNPHYGPDLCRWADKKTQSLNRSTVTTFTANGVTKSISELAKEQGNSVAKLRGRVRAGWTDAEIMADMRDRDVAELGWPPGSGQKLEHQYLTELAEGRIPLNTTRMHWLRDTAKSICDSLHRHFENNVDWDAPVSAENERKGRDHDRWERLYHYADERLREAARREAIINRPGGRGRKLEARTYDAFMAARRREQ